MAIRFYDEALANKISMRDKGNKLHILKPDEVNRLFQMKADIGKDSPINLPLIAISRDREINILNTNKKSMSFDGMKIRAFNEDGNEIKLNNTFTLNAIPIQIGYQLDIYTRFLDEGDEYLRNFIYNFINYPNLTINIPYNGVRLTHESTIYLDSVVQDNSDIPQQLFPDQFTRYTIKLVVDNAYLFSVPSKEFASIEEDGGLFVKDRNEIYKA